MERFNDMQQIKRHFFAMRNGIVADVLRKAGSPFRIIFGLTLPQITDVANATGKNAELARRLWDNKTTRCSMLLAPMIMPEDAIEKAEALQWCADAPVAEVTDVLCHRLLCRLPYASEMVELLAEGDVSARYTSLRLALNLVRRPDARLDGWERMARDEEVRGEAMTRMVAHQLADEIDFIKNPI
ncbi:MAG: hypothetical protein OSJ34_04885 [Muribaculaceae bacterium]|jgi:hypothetical protein|nr:hypothetical protein [Muribaculaceae bacterium]